MNPRTKRKLEKINERLELFQQTTRIVKLSTTELILNTGNIFYENDAGRFIKRVMNNNVLEWVKNTDKLLSGEIQDTDIKFISCSKGGKACQALHGDKIKQNLNNGIPWNAGTKGENIGSMGPRPQSVKNKISVGNSGENNGRYGYHYSDDEKKVKSEKMKELILSGEFTPKLNNRNTHWESSLDNVMYRSSWEAWYKFINPNAEYESLRITYSFNGESKIYIVDFIDNKAKQVIEVKPKELCVGDKFNCKINALKDWANTNSYSVLIVDKLWLITHTTHLDYTRFDKKTAEKIKGLYETHKKDRN